VSTALVFDKGARMNKVLKFHRLYLRDYWLMIREEAAWVIRRPSKGSDAY
jgi:hypothetical protein